MIIKRSFCLFRIDILFMWFALKSDLKRIMKQLLNWKTMLLFLFVVAVMSSEVWVMYILGFVFHNAWFTSIGSTCWLFWLGPGTPFIPLCIAITLSIRGAWISHLERKRK